MRLTALNSAAMVDRPRLAAHFQAATPFRHLIIDDFFAADVAQSLLDQFPAFERGDARNEAGELGGKSVVERIRGLGPSYALLDDLVQSRSFLDHLGQITGIPDLLYDPHYVGGGTHENRAGQDLDPHIDFNRHPLTGLHRRLNLIVYLNPQWSEDWGGGLELHSDPRAPDNRITLICPRWNRAVIFETTECSWHGFSSIVAPAGHSRRSIALYFYTATRPAEQLAPPHSTIYVDRPLPAHLRAGHQLEPSDEQQLQRLLARRDQHIQRLYRDVRRLDAQLAQAQQLLRQRPLSRLKDVVLGLLGRPR